MLFLMLIFQYEWRHSYWQVCTSIRPIGDNFTLIQLPLRGRPILLITRVITDRTGLHSVLLPLLIRSQVQERVPTSRGKQLNVKNEGSRLTFYWKGEVSQ